MSATTIRLSPAQTLTVVSATVDRLEISSTWTAGGAPPPMHWHPVQHEHFEVLEGELTAGLEHAAARALQAGDELDVPARTGHRMWNAGAAPCRASWVITPALRTEEMFRAIERSRSKIGTAARLLTTFRDEYRFGSPRG